MSRSVSAGLETSASLLGKQSVLYRKYNTSDLVQNCSFDEVAYLLIYGYLPTEQQLNAFSARIESFREIPDPIKRGIELCGEDVVLIDLVAMGIAMLRNLRPEGEVFTQFDVIESILASIASIAAYWKHWRLSGARISTRGNKGDSIVQHLLRVWTLEEPLAENVELMNRAMILNAEHGFAASTFAARIAISAKSDVYSAVLAAIGTMKGVFDGGAAEIAALLFSMNSVEQVEKHVQNILRNKERVMGFGHRVYKTSADPRIELMKEFCKKHGSSSDKGQKMQNLAEHIEKIVWNNKRLFPNINFYLAYAFLLCGIDVKLFTVISCISRFPGWSAHILEERPLNKLIRPKGTSNSTKQRTFIPRSERSIQAAL